MNITLDDAALIYARACRAWYGRSALRVVTTKINELKRRGDASGVVAWSKVAAVLSQPKIKDRSGKHAGPGFEAVIQG
jgi:hypothetical protein